MLDGLRKGTETIKNKAGQTLSPWKCPVCERTLMLLPYEIKSRKYCSNECSTKDNTWGKGVINGAEKSHKNNVEFKKIVKQDIIEWVLNNQDCVINCPYNKIVTTLSGMMDMLLSKYNIMDIRSIFICFNVNNRKELLNELKKIVISKENVCQASLN